MTGTEGIPTLASRCPTKSSLISEWLQTILHQRRGYQAQPSECDDRRRGTDATVCHGKVSRFFRLPAMNRVLVTGATGFVGRQCLAPLSKDGWEIHATSLKGSVVDAPASVNWHEIDLLNADRVAGLLAEVRPTHLIHFAWHAVPGDYWTSQENFRWVQASLVLFRVFASCGGRRAVVAGSCAEYDWRYGYCSETVTPGSPATVYGAC